MGAILGIGFFLLVVGFFVVEICYPARWHTKGVWLLTSFVGIPAAFLVLGVFAAWPPLIVLALIAAFAGDHVKKR